MRTMLPPTVSLQVKEGDIINVSEICDGWFIAEFNGRTGTSFGDSRAQVASAEKQTFFRHVSRKLL